MLKCLLLALLVIPCVNCSLDNVKDLFVYKDVKETSLENCYPSLNRQYYWQSISKNNISDFTKLDCLPQELSKNKYFPKCCPPNHVYHKTHHKCLLRDSINIYDAFGQENLLIRSGLNNCTVILDKIIKKDGNGWSINEDRSLNFGNKSYRLGYYCLDNHLDDDSELILRTCEDVDVCRKNNVRCIKKCCRDGYYYEGATCVLGPYFGLSLENNTRFLDKSEKYDAIMVSQPCRRYIGKSIYNYSIASNGTTSIYERGAWRQFALEENYYCMEYVQLTNKHEILLCMIDSTLKPEFGAKGVIMVISCICLILTVCGYFILPDLKNLIGNIVITYCICLTVAFMSLIYLQFNPNPGKFCAYFGFTIAFLFVTAFTWMAILSYEIWRVLGSMVSEYGHRSPGERKRYLCYSIVGWLVPIVLISVNITDYKYNIFPNAIHLVVAVEKCTYENNIPKGMYGYLFHFALPCAIILCINLTIFVKTIIYIFQVKNEIQRVKALDTNVNQTRWKSFVADKEKVFMVIRIFLLMGINWLFETISSIVNFQKYPSLSTIEAIFDIINASQGIFIFCIFMLKKRILKSLMKILNIKMKNRRMSVATCSTEVVMLPTSMRNSATLLKRRKATKAQQCAKRGGVSDTYVTLDASDALLDMY